MPFFYFWRLEADYQPTSRSENSNQEGCVSATVRRTLDHYRLCTCLCGSSGRGDQAAAHALLQQSPASLWQIDVFLPSSSQTDEFVSYNKGLFCFFVLNKAKQHCCLSLQHSAVYFTPRAISISQEDKLPHWLLYSLLAAPQITSAYVYTPCFKSQTTPRDGLLCFAPFAQEKELFTLWQFWAKWWWCVFIFIEVLCNWWKLKLCILEK